MEAFTLLERIVELGKTSDEVRSHQFFALAHRCLGFLRGSYYSPDLAQQRRFHEEVIVHFVTALKSGREKDAKTCHALGVAYFYLGNHTAAVQLLEEALTLNDRDVHARYLLSTSYLFVNDQVRARQHFEVLEREAPHLADQLKHRFSKPEKQGAESEQQDLLQHIKRSNFRRQC